MTIHYEGFGVTLYHGDCLEVMRELPDASVDAVVTDPPYDLTSGKKGGAGTASVNPDSPAGRSMIGTGNGSGGFMGKCLHPDTDLLTTEGWTPVLDVRVGDEVASLNPDTGAIEYVGVTATHDYNYDDDLLLVGGRSTAQFVTPNHMVWTERGLVRADRLRSKFRLYNQGVWKGSEVEKIDIGGEPFLAAPLLRFLGLWLGDGYAVDRIAQPWKQDYIGFTVKKARKVDAIRNACADLGVRFTETPSTDGRTVFYVYDKALLGWLSPIAGAHTKRIPHEVMGLSAALLEHLYQGLIETDGTRQGAQGQQVYFTVSEQLADDFQTVCLLTGRSAVKTFRKPPDRPSTLPNGQVIHGDGIWVLSVVQSRDGFWMERDGRTTRPQPANVQRVLHIGEVGCVTLERNHIMMTRYDGRTVWTGNSWDSTGIAFKPDVWLECMRVLKPGGHLLAFGGSRTYHRMTCAIEDAGFEIRDSIAWLQGQGFPKSLDVSKAIDKMAGAEREVVSEGDPVKRMIPGADQNSTGSWVKDNGREYVPTVTAPATDEAARWQGWGTALRPCHEPIVVARKPLEGTVAQNVLTHGTGAINIDATRLATTDKLGGGAETETRADQKGAEGWTRPWMDDPDARAAHAERVRSNVARAETLGRWPSNVALSHSPDCEPVGTKSVSSNGHHPASRGQGGIGNDGHKGQDGLVERAERTEVVTAWACAPGCQVAALDAQTGELSKNDPAVWRSDRGPAMWSGIGNASAGDIRIGHSDSGGASRFFKTVEQNLDDLPIRAFYTAKAGQSERPVVGDSRHVTVKPLDLMRWLVKLVTPPGGVVLDPFVGSGTTAEACVIEGFQCVAIEREEPYLPLTVARVTRQRDPVVHTKLVGTAEPTLFDLL